MPLFWRAAQLGFSEDFGATEVFRITIITICFYRFAQEYRAGSHYFVLLILTDGIITDMPMTKQAIINVSAFIVICRFIIPKKYVLIHQNSW